MQRRSAAAQGTAPPQDGEQPAESPEPPPPWPPPPQPPLLPSPPARAPWLLRAPSPEPAPQFCPELAPEPGPAATPEPASELETEPILEPDREPAPDPAPEPIPVPAVEPAPEPAPVPAREPATESCPEPAQVSRLEQSPAPHLLQCPVVAPEKGLRTSPTPRTPVPAPLSSIKRPKLWSRSRLLDPLPATGEGVLSLGATGSAPGKGPESLLPAGRWYPIRVGIRGWAAPTRTAGEGQGSPERTGRACVRRSHHSICLQDFPAVFRDAFVNVALHRDPPAKGGGGRKKVFRLSLDLETPKTASDLQESKILKEGPLLKSCNSFKRWKLRYFLVRGQRLCFAHHPAFARFETIDLSQVALAESSCRNLCHSFCVITPQRNVTLAAPNRKDMEEWINVIKTVQQGEIRKIPAAENNPFLTGMHYWYSSHSPRTQHCNVCRGSIPALSQNVIICEVCKVKSHRLCALRANKDCKWNTLSITDDLLMPADEKTMPHQWVEGNISASSQCAVCHENCGSYQRLQDFRCLWCNSTVHDDCRRRFSKECWFGSHRSSVIPPTALSDPKGDGQLVVSPDFWNLDWSSACSCPLLIFINSKSGDHQGIVFLRKFKQYLNPSQVFDLSKGGPEAGLCMFKNFARFRVVVCGGDGSVNWVLSLIDAFGLHEQCQLAVIPLGTGNDLARVLGWGAFWNKNKSPLNILNRVEQAGVRILDRWSVMIRETPRQTPLLRGQVEMDVPRFEAAAIQHLESATTELNKILKAKYPTEMIIATRFLCSAVEDFVVDIVKAWSRIKQNNTAIESVILKSDLMYDKLSVLIDILAEDVAVEKSAKAHKESAKADGEPSIPQIDHIAKCKLELATKAQNLQKSLKLIIFQVEQVLDEESRQTISVKNFSSTFFLEDDSEDINQMSPRHRSRLGTLSSISSLKSEDLENLNLEHLHFTPETIRFKEKCVMNNYFGIGLDAKISLEFNTRRDEHPGQYNSRFKNKMWYGLLGSKELFQRSYRKLEERVHLECDGEAISLPNLQGIVVLNITSYAGGVNFWGSSTATTEYEAPAIDDGKLEVVAIFGSVQMAMSRIINLHHHRIAQCREVMITINGEEGIPVQVDGEAWVQRPGLIKIRYKNTAQMLTRDRDFENSMKMWECKHSEIQAASQPQLDTQESQDSLSDEEYAQMQHLTRLAENLISTLTDLSKVHQHVSVLMDSVNASANILNDVFYKQESSNETAAASCIPIETLTRNEAVDVAFSLKGLYDDTKAFLDENLLRNAEYEATLKISLDAMNKEFEKLSKIDWMNSILFLEEKSSDSDSKSFRLKVKFPKLGKKKSEEEYKPKSGQGIQGFIGNLWHHRHQEDEAKYDDPPTPSGSQL
ncbi:diacylglycerol kinase kappa [Cervus elaphus]|uniref:diacylglycerol kinase kappa n=1 Tax=Cervus canadensis TaxID=1574408 RepID=UPI001CA30646|nr:diacylglycerol kinase kappa [Cervus canadensis]XP_043753357.1 diacylglycerol kinase kappa [Cervus elaphus]